MIEPALENYSEGQDFATLTLTIGGRSDAYIAYEDGLVRVRIPLYAHEAKELAETILPLSWENEAA